jgi:hypothetical protein
MYLRFVIKTNNTQFPLQSFSYHNAPFQRIVTVFPFALKIPLYFLQFLKNLLKTSLPTVLKPRSQESSYFVQAGQVSSYAYTQHHLHQHTHGASAYADLQRLGESVGCRNS